MTMIDQRDVPRLAYRPCNQCDHRHYYTTDVNDADNCAMCGGSLYSISTIVAAATPPTELLQYVRHHPSCASEACTCGLTMLLAGIPKWVEPHLGRHLGYKVHSALGLNRKDLGAIEEFAQCMNPGYPGTDPCGMCRGCKLRDKVRRLLR